MLPIQQLILLLNLQFKSESVSCYQHKLISLGLKQIKLFQFNVPRDLLQQSASTDRQTHTGGAWQ
jgi:hypothetical protein